MAETTTASRTTRQLKKQIQQQNEEIAALRDRKQDSIEAIKETLKKDKTFRFEVNRWPVFKQIRSTPELLSIFERIGDK